MPFFPWVAAQFAKLTGEVVKTGVETVKSAVEIPKAIVETEKAKLEVGKLKDEQQERGSLLTHASMEDVKAYDPNFQKIIRKVRTLDHAMNLEIQSCDLRLEPRGTKRTRYVLLVAAAMVVGLAFGFLYHRYR
jgi:hypothetical protein